MKKFYTIFLFFFGGQIVLAQQNYNPSETKLFDLIHTELHLKPDWTRNEMEGRAILQLRPWFYAQDQLILDAKGFQIHSVGLNDQQARFEYDKLKLNIHLDRSYTKTDTVQVIIEYTARPDKLQEIEPLKSSTYKGLYFINQSNSRPQQIWTEGETEYNSCWFPTLDSPNQKHTQEIHLTVPKVYKTLSNGLLVSSKDNEDETRTDVWKQNIPHSVYLTMIAAGDFTKVTDPRFKDFEVSYYVEPEFEESAQAIFGRTPAMIRYFEDLLNIKYPWSKYAQIAVRDYVSGAMENTTATVHGSSVQKNGHQLIDGNDDGVIAHELFHHWFGDYVTAESWANLSLNEAFANYSEYLWASHFYGKAEGEWLNFTELNQYLDESDSKQVPVIRYGYEDKEEMFDSHSYAKGGRILHMIRQEVGDEAFFKALEVYLKENKLKNAEIHNLRMAFEEVTGRDLNWLFDQWFLTAGHPRLNISHSYENEQLKIEIFQQTDSVNNQIYRFPLKIEIGTENGTRIEELEIDQNLEVFSFNLAEQPLFVVADPFSDFLGVIDQDQTEEELFAQSRHSKGAIARAKAFNFLSDSENLEGELSLNAMFDEKRRELAIEMLTDPFWKIREMAVHKFFDYDGDDFLKVERRLQSVIRTDEKSNVRSAAILAMKNFLNPQNDLLFRKSLADTSYAVRAAALEAILISNPPDADSLTHMMEDIKDVNIFVAVANHKAAKAEPEDYQWFEDRMSKLSGSELYQTMGVLGSYLVRAPVEIQWRSIPFLKEIAMNETNWIGRYAATQALLLLTEHPQALEALKEVIATETNEQLKEMYQQIPVD
ncbi:M1 family metallopeptidase [Jiulongibacter sediminis]|uniref:M1 family metallopeptidase n=1 Tax=Jiulongibacter sediminis TaxID=1605367 RepID=UPI0026ECE565|nr:M1 family metallopeptidase [Jiulongibacter sediminis]